MASLIVKIKTDKKIHRNIIDNTQDFLRQLWVDSETVEIKIDESDIEQLSKIPWTPHTTGGYPRGSINGKAVFLHRYLLSPPDDMVVDHINRDVFDARRCNLRVCTTSTNNYNRGSSNIRKIGKNWNVYFKVDGVQRSFGTFNTLQQATKRRDEIKPQFLKDTNSKHELLTYEPNVRGGSGERYIRRPHNGKYVVVIGSSKNRKYIGTFNSLQEAIRARDKVLIKKTGAS